MKSIVSSILLMIGTVYLVRLLPLLFLRKDIRNKWVKSFFYYVPYVTLAVMTFPAIVETTLSPVSGIVALVVGIIAAWRGAGLFPVAIICCAIVYLMDGMIL